MAEGINVKLLERDGLDAHWKELSATLSRLLTWMDSREGWVSEPSGEVLDLLLAVIEKTETPNFILGIERGAGAAALAEVFANLHSSRYLRVIEMMDRRVPGLASRLTLAMGRIGGIHEPYADLFFERLMAIHQSELLAQVFSVSRATKIEAAVRMIRESR